LNPITTPLRADRIFTRRDVLRIGRPAHQHMDVHMPWSGTQLKLKPAGPEAALDFVEIVMVAAVTDVATSGSGLPS